MKAKTVCAWGFYYAGDLASRIGYLWSTEWIWDKYQRLMQRSAELDPDYEVWERAEEGEDEPPEPEQ